VDVGAAHPVKESNTYHFYRRGWRGVCVDATPGLAPLYRKYRPRDVFVNGYVTRKKGKNAFFVFNEPLLNTGTAARKKFLIQKTPYTLLKKLKIARVPLREILAQHLPEGQKINLMSLDVEEGELEVLQSNNWEKNRPQVIVMEILHPQRDKIGEVASAKFLKKQDYRPTIILNRSVFFLDDQNRERF